MEILYFVFAAIYKYACFDKGVDINKKNRPWYEHLLVKLGLLLTFKKSSV